MESELTLYSLGTHHPMPPKTFKALTVKLESPNLEPSFLLQFLAMVPTFKIFGTAVKLSKKVNITFKALRVEIESPNLEHSFILQMLNSDQALASAEPDVALALFVIS